MAIVARRNFRGREERKGPTLGGMRTIVDASELTDEQLAAEAAREGSDGPAFAELMRRHQERIWRVCYRLMDNAEDASDAAQEVLVRMFLGRQKFAALSKYTTWLHGIAIRTCLSLRRGRGRRRKYESRAQEEEARAVARGQEVSAGQATASEQAIDLNQILSGLDDEDRALLILKYAEGYSHEELAEMFQISVSACKMRISRTCEKLRERFPGHHFDAGETE